jgi:hypothetical protein
MDRQLTLHPPLLGGLDQIGRKELLIDKIFYLDISNTSYSSIYLHCSSPASLLKIVSSERDKLIPRLRSYFLA